MAQIATTSLLPLQIGSHQKQSRRNGTGSRGTFLIEIRRDPYTNDRRPTHEMLVPGIKAVLSLYEP